MKKILALLLAIAMICSFVACSNSKGTDEPTSNSDATTQSPTDVEGDNTTDGADATTPNDNDPSDTDKRWIQKGIALPHFDPLVITEKKLTDTVKVKIAKTPFDIDINDVAKKIGKLEYVKNNYTPLIKHDGQAQTSTLDFASNQYLVSYSTGTHYEAEMISNAQPVLPSECNDLVISAGYLSAFYENTSYINLKFTGIETLDNQTQNSIYEIAKLVFEDYAEFLVYGKDVDGLNSKGGSIGAYNMVDFVRMDDATIYEGTVYGLSRTISYHDHSKYIIEFEVYVDNNPYADPLIDDYGKDSQPLYNHVPLKLTDILPDAFGGRDIVENRNMGDKYFKSLRSSTPYIFTDAGSTSTNIYYGNDGSKEYSILFSLDGRYEGVKINDFSYDVRYIEKPDDSISFIDIHFSGETNNLSNIMDVSQSNKEAACKAIHDDIKAAISCVAPNIDLSDIAYNTEENDKTRNYRARYEIPTEFMGQQMVAEITIKIEGYGEQWECGEYQVNIKLPES
jgi:hypothetical protein